MQVLGRKHVEWNNSFVLLPYLCKKFQILQFSFRKRYMKDKFRKDPSG